MYHFAANRTVSFALLSIALSLRVDAQIAFTPLDSFPAPCGAATGLGITSEGLAVLCSDCDSLIVIDRRSGVRTRAVQISDTALGYLCADTGGNLYAWRRTDGHVYHVNASSGTLALLSDTLTSSRVFTCDGADVYLLRNEGTWSEMITRVSLAPAGETMINYGTGNQVGIHKDRYLWRMLTGGAATFMEVYDLEQPPVSPDWHWQTLPNADLVPVPVPHAWGLAKINDTLWTFGTRDSLVHILRSPDASLVASHTMREQGSKTRVSSEQFTTRSCDLLGRNVDVRHPCRSPGVIVIWSGNAVFIAPSNSRLANSVR